MAGTWPTQGGFMATKIVPPKISNPVLQEVIEAIRKAKERQAAPPGWHKYHNWNNWVNWWT
jgi:hypothetical protein